MSRYANVALAILASAMAGCQTWGPTWSEITGARYTAAIADRRAAILSTVGDESVGSVQPFKVHPGTYRVVVQSPRHNGFPGTNKEMTLAMDPCRRYYVNAQFDNPTTPQWEPVVDHVETIAGCTTSAH
jgi:hypothetical protein